MLTIDNSQAAGTSILPEACAATEYEKTDRGFRLFQVRKIIPLFAMVLALFIVDSTLITDTADARSKRGGRTFKSAPKKSPTQATAPTTQNKKSGFGRGLLGGLLGGALGAMLFGSLMGGEGMGILPILLLAGVGFFMFRRFARARQNTAGPGGFGQTMHGNSSAPSFDPVQSVNQGLEQIRQTDPGFDTANFLETASDAFFQVQAGWMRRDLDSYRNLLGTQLAAEYEQHFAEMRSKGVINKLESIAIRKVDIAAAGSTGTEDFVTVLFAANLLDYTVDDTTGELVEGSKTDPVKFEEKWTFARPTGTNNWRLEGIE